MIVRAMVILLVQKSLRQTKCPSSDAVPEISRDGLKNKFQSAIRGIAWIKRPAWGNKVLITFLLAALA